jgi:diguanylate cyclase (GGDEF)-like protein
MLLPAGAALIALTLVFSATIHPVTRTAVGLATAALLAAGVRAALTYRENARVLVREKLEASTDALTRLGNRRRLMEDLERTADDAQRGAASTLAFFDLDGFKRYNDSFGHGAGDALLVRLGDCLAQAVEDYGRAYRLGGDEFCVLYDGRHRQGEAVVRAARAALAERGAGFVVTASCGTVVLPDDADSVSTALNLADERMYTDKAGSENSSRARAHAVLTQQSVLMQLLSEREPDLHDHLCDVGELAAAIGRSFDMDSERLDELRRAAELHDVGKLAVPDHILSKPGPLNDGEWALMRQHTIIGERILNAAPALRLVALLVRSSHERWDGGGYPDGLAGEQIPLGSRIIAACDAYHAMISERSYDAARPRQEALEELRRSAGTQFDTDVVDALCAYVIADPLRAPGASRAPARGRSVVAGEPARTGRPGPGATA